MQRVPKGQIQIHGSLDAPHQPVQIVRQPSRCSSHRDGPVPEAAENIPAEECRESKVYRINTLADREQQPRSIAGHKSTRSGDGRAVLLENPIKVKVNNPGRARNTGSVDAQKQRDRSLGSTLQSTPQK